MPRHGRFKTYNLKDLISLSALVHQEPVVRRCRTIRRAAHRLLHLLRRLLHQALIVLLAPQVFIFWVCSLYLCVQVIKESYGAGSGLSLCLHAAPYFDVSINPITSCHFFSSHICVTVTRLSPLRILRTLLPHRGRGHPLVVRPLGSCSVGRRGTTIPTLQSGPRPCVGVAVKRLLFFQIRYVVVRDLFDQRKRRPAQRR